MSASAPLADESSNARAAPTKVIRRARLARARALASEIAESEAEAPVERPGEPTNSDDAERSARAPRAREPEASGAPAEAARPLVDPASAARAAARRSVDATRSLDEAAPNESEAVRVAPPKPSNALGAAAGDRAKSAKGRTAAAGSVMAVSGGAVTANMFASAPRPATIGDLVAMPTSKGRVYGMVRAVRQGRRADDNAIVDIRLLGEITKTDQGWRFSRGVSAHPGLYAKVVYPSREEQLAVYARPEAPFVKIGSIASENGGDAYLLADELLGKHFAVIGSTGSGKSCTVAVVLRGILDRFPMGHVVVLDPHSEYSSAFGDRTHKLDTSTLVLPYWLLNFEELSTILTRRDTERGAIEGHILKDAVLAAKRAFLGVDDEEGWLTVDTPSPYRISDVSKHIEEAMGALNKPDGAAPYMSLLARIDSVRTDQRYAFMFQSFRMQDSMAEILADLLRIPTNGKPVTVLDIAGVPSEVVDVVVSVLCRMVFEFALWREPGSTPPVLFVCEEAHRYVPQDDSAAFAPSRAAIARIAKEGRKYGVSLCLVSQRPSELSTSALSQCNTVVALRVSNDRDRKFVAAALPDGSDWLIDTLPGLREGEAVVIGEGVSVPMRVRLDRLPPESRPASATPKFSQEWARDDADLAAVEQTVHRWRRQIR